MVIPQKRGPLTQLLIIFFPLILLSLLLSYYFAFGFGSFSRLKTQMIGTGDELLVIYIFETITRNFLEGNHLFDGGFYYPFHTKSLLFFDVMPMLGVFYRLFEWFTRQRVFAFNLVILLCFSANFLSMYVLMRRGIGRLGAIVSGSIFSFSMVRLLQIGHTQLLPQFFLPLIIFFVDKFHKSLKNRYVVLSGLCLAAQFYASASLGMMTLICLIPYSALSLWKVGKKQILSLSIGAAVFAIFLFPLASQYMGIRNQFEWRRSLDEARVYSAHITNYWLVPPDHAYSSLLRSRLVQRGLFATHEKHLFVGLAVLIACLLSWRIMGSAAGPFNLGWSTAAEPFRFWRMVGITTILFTIWVSLGPQARLYTLLYEMIPGMGFLRTPARFGLIYLFIISAWAGWGIHVFISMTKHKALVYGGLVVLGCLFVFENKQPVQMRKIPTSLKETANFLASRPDQDPVLYLPLHHDPTLRHYYSTFHRHPMVNGYASFTPPYIEELYRVVSNIGGLESPIALLQKKDIRYIVIEKGALPFEERRNWLSILTSVSLSPIYEDRTTVVYDIGGPGTGEVVL